MQLLSVLWRRVSGGRALARLPTLAATYVILCMYVSLAMPRLCIQERDFIIKHNHLNVNVRDFLESFLLIILNMKISWMVPEELPPQNVSTGRGGWC